MISLEEIKRRVAYDPETGVFTHLRDSTHGKVGQVAGTLCLKGYLKLNFSFKGKQHKIRGHRLAWAMFYGDWPPGELDHINGRRSDNRIGNLRLASRSQNMMNKPCRGIYFDPRRRKWMARIKVNKKTFWLGYHDTEESALAAYRDAAPKFHGEFARCE